MQPIRPKVQGRARLFQNPFLELLTLSSPYVIWGMYIPIVAGLLYYSVAGLGLSVGATLLTFAAALFAWTLAEYLLHRFVFHWVDERPWVQRFHYLVHGVHHEYPSDPHHLFMPPVPSLLLASAFGGLFYLLLGSYGFPFLAGFIIGYLLYSTTHYLMHRIKNPPTKLLKKLWRHHHMHHFKSPERAFGVSSPLWDWVFGTLPEEKRSTPSPKAA